MYFTIKIFISAAIIDEGRTSQEINAISWDILYMVIPSLILFIIFPILLNRGMSFSLSLITSTLIMSVGYLITFKILVTG
jgi:hypothetical protein